MNEQFLKTMKRFNHLLGEIEGTYHEASLKLGVSDSVLKILYTMCYFDNQCLLSDLCRHTGLSKQTVNSAIRKLENDRLVYLQAVDGKTKRVCLSPAGEEFARQTAGRVLNLENKIFSTWSDAEFSGYLMLTERYLAALRESISQL